LNHWKFTSALCTVAGRLFYLGAHETQPNGRRAALEAIRDALNEALVEPEPDRKPPETPQTRVVYQVQSTCNGEDWVHHPHEFESEALAARWARGDHTLWQRICRTETSYKLVPRSGR
jgi:hypothetical protein